MAIGESRREAKQAIRASGERVWAFSTGKIHSFKTRSVYQEQILRFINWCREIYQVRSLLELDVRADELACQYLTEQIQANKSPYTLQLERSALRLFFANRSLAQSVMMPRRARTRIIRSRGPAMHDRHFQPANWERLLNFLRATGLPRNELRLLRVRDIVEWDTDPDYSGQTTVKVINGKGGKSRAVPVLAGQSIKLSPALSLTLSQKQNRLRSSFSSGIGGGDGGELNSPSKRTHRRMYYRLSRCSF